MCSKCTILISGLNISSRVMFHQPVHTTRYISTELHPLFLCMGFVSLQESCLLCFLAPLVRPRAQFCYGRSHWWRCRRSRTNWIAPSVPTASDSWGVSAPAPFWYTGTLGTTGTHIPPELFCHKGKLRSFCFKRSFPPLLERLK